MRAVTLALLILSTAILVATAYTILPVSSKSGLRATIQAVKDSINKPGVHVFYTKYIVSFRDNKIIVTDGADTVEEEVEGKTLIDSSGGQGKLVVYVNSTHAWLTNPRP